MKKLTLLVLFTIVIGCFGIGCTPAVPPYPYKPFADLDAKAQKMSDDINAYIKDWAAGKVAAQIPSNLVPDNINKHVWYKPRGLQLKNPDLMAPIDKMGIRKAYVIDRNALTCLFPDPHCSYLIPQTTFGPFGSKLVLKGQFPHCRYFSVQVTPPYDSRFYCYLGLGETVIGDVDITPDAGSVNPFVVGANRNAANRNYTVNIEYRKGNITTICGDTHKPPYYRNQNSTNTRYGSGFYHMGPLMDPNYIGPDGKAGIFAPNEEGPWRVTALWIRYYAPDGWGKAGFDPWAKVPCPDWYMQLPTGEKFIAWTDPRMVEKEACKTKKVIASTTSGDPAGYADADDGFEKQWGIFRAIFDGLMKAIGNNDKKYMRDYVLGATGCGESQPGPGSWEPSESCSNHIKYMVRGMAINTGKVAVICGQMPTFPKTLDGQATMEGAKQIRYFSITSYDTNMESDGMLNAGGCTTIMDEHIVLDSTRKYVLCYSRLADRPTNATSAAGVTWIDWGPTYNQNWTCRWLAVYPDWYMTDKTPDETKTSMATTCYDGSKFDPNIMANNRNGLMKEFAPVTYYLNKTSFQNLGTPVTEAKIKGVGWGCGSSISEGSNTWMALVPLILLIFANGIWILRRR